jgi:hypothetical protein
MARRRRIPGVRAGDRSSNDIVGGRSDLPFAARKACHRVRIDDGHFDVQERQPTGGDLFVPPSGLATTPSSFGER